MSFRDYIPFYKFSPSEQQNKKQAQVVDADGPVSKLLKTVSLALGFTGVSFGARTTFEPAPYDFNRIINAIDTDSFVNQAFRKYRELLWKEGWDIVGENDISVDYLRERLDYMEFAMRRSFQSFLEDVADQLVKFGNCFCAKIRGDLGPYFPGQLTPLGENEEPIVGYEIIPAETVEIRRDRHNRVISYRQQIDSLVDGFQTRRQPRWDADEVIHFSLDKKPGRVFGTPFTVPVLDDVVALRQIEEDIQNLVHQELFPLYKYQVGTEEHPAEKGEIEDAAAELENMRNDGGIILPERHDVDVIGAENTALDATGYLKHFLTRVCVGLGLAPHHLGVHMEGGNRSVTDRLDIALYDKIKTYQKYIADTIRISIFSELLIEGGFDPIEHPAIRGQSDRCEFKFKEIDVDTQVKKENHIINKYVQNAITLPEVRLELGLDPEVQEELLNAAVMARLGPKQEKSAEGTMHIDVPKKPDAITPSKGGVVNRRNNKDTANKSRPANQHGRRNSPNIRHALSDDKLQELVELLKEEEEDD